MKSQELLMSTSKREGAHVPSFSLKSMFILVSIAGLGFSSRLKSSRPSRHFAAWYAHPAPTRSLNAKPIDLKSVISSSDSRSATAPLHICISSPTTWSLEIAPSSIGTSTSPASLKQFT